MSSFVAGHRSLRFAPQRLGSLVRRANFRRFRSGMRFCVVSGAYVIAYGLRRTSVVPALPFSPAPHAADRASRMLAPHSVAVTASAFCAASAVLAAFSFCTAPVLRPSRHPAFERSNIPVKAAPAFGLRWTLRDKTPRSALYL